VARASEVFRVAVLCVQAASTTARFVSHADTRLYFAGEATHKEDAYTVHGAYLSGDKAVSVPALLPAGRCRQCMPKWAHLGRESVLISWYSRLHV
jgi:Flavin containing amine oxidoreductase